MSHWPEYMSTASDHAIQGYITDHRKYLPEAVEAAIAELAKRNRPLSQEEIAAIRTNVQEAQVELNRLETGSDEHTTNDREAPLLYTATTLYTCAFLFGIFFAGILFCINLSSVRKTAWILPVLVISFAVTIAQVFVLSSLPAGQFFGPLVSLGVTYLYRHKLWPKITEPDLKYRKRSALYPALIGIVLCVLYIVAVIKFM